MEVKGIAWVGTRTSQYAAMVRLFGEGLGLRMAYEQPDFAVFELPNGDNVEVFGPSDTERTYFDSGPVVGFRVGDVERARAELEATGMVELLGPLRRWPDGIASQHFRAPDGNVYEVLGPVIQANG